MRTSTYRPNLTLRARSFQKKTDSYPELQKSLRAHPGSTIIYVTTHKHTEDLAERLRGLRFKARHFHAGMKVDEKRACQEEFMAADDVIVVATIAFGMGLDKSNIRNVVHYDIPRSLEGYSQEIGRAGRDGLESHCLLYLCAEDLHLRQSFARGDLPSNRSVRALIEEVFSAPQITTAGGATIEASVYNQSTDFDIRPTVLNNLYAQLELRFGLLRATTPKYTAYWFEQKATTASDVSVEATAIRKHSVKKKRYTYVEVDAGARDFGIPRESLVRKLNDWNDDRLIELGSKGVVNIYRIMKPLGQSAKEQQEIVDTLYADLEQRERQALDRMRAVIDLVSGSECITAALARHFGDALPDGKQECGHCSWCETKTAVPRVEPSTRPWDASAFRKVLDAVPARDDPRFLARVAFGITSPRVTREKLSNSAVFGSMEDHDFVTLLSEFTKMCNIAK